LHHVARSADCAINSVGGNNDFEDIQTGLFDMRNSILRSRTQAAARKRRKNAAKAQALGQIAKVNAAPKER
jgi:hypothetical protein